MIPISKDDKNSNMTKRLSDFANAHNLQALTENLPLLPVEIGLRGTLMKLGLDDSVADLYDRYQVKGHLGHLIRQAAYVDLLPTPARNFKGTVEWLSDELFHRVVER
jgi:demethylphylloquinone reductase